MTSSFSTCFPFVPIRAEQVCDLHSNRTSSTERSINKPATQITTPPGDSFMSAELGFGDHFHIIGIQSFNI